MYSSTDPDTLRPVVLLGKFKHVVSPIQPEEQGSRLRDDGQGYVKLSSWYYRSGNRNTNQGIYFLN